MGDSSIFLTLIHPTSKSNILGESFKDDYNITNITYNPEENQYKGHNIITYKYLFTLSADSTIKDVINHITSRGFLNIYHTHNTENGNRISFTSSDNYHDDTAATTLTKPTLCELSCSDKTQLSLYDSTIYPSKDVTNLIHQFDQTTGPNSITLYDLQWFPSVKLVILDSKDSLAKDFITDNHKIISESHYDYQYNIPKYNTTTTSYIQNSNIGMSHLDVVSLTNYPNSTLGQPPLPSQILNSVHNRFADQEFQCKQTQHGMNHNHMIITNSKPKKLLQEKQQQQQQQRQRWKKLDLQLQRLNSIIDKQQQQQQQSTKTNNHTKISTQVRNMLIKSRAKGNENIRFEDRIFLEIVIIDSTRLCDSSSSSADVELNNDSNEDRIISSSYRYYSKHVNVGNILSSVKDDLNLSSSKISEVLISMNDKTTNISNTNQDEQGTIMDDADEESYSIYKRLPNTMHMYEAESLGFINSFDRVIIRIFDIGDGPNNSTPLVTIPSVISLNNEDILTDGTIYDSNQSRSTSNIKDDFTIHNISNSTGSDSQIFQKINDILRQQLQDEKGKKKSTKPASEKVRQILIKGKAKGDKAKVKDTDRFYFEIVLLDHLKDGDMNSSIHYLFFSRYEMVAKIADHFLSPTKGEIKPDDDILAEVLVKDDINTYSVLDDMRICDAEKKKYIEDYDRIFVRRFNSSVHRKISVVLK